MITIRDIIAFGLGALACFGVLAIIAEIYGNIQERKEQP